MLNDGERIDHMIEVIDHLMQIISGITVKEYAASISDAVKNQFPDIPWRSIRGMRNMIAHDYIKTDDELVFRTAATDVAPLREQLLAVKKAI